MSFKKLLQLGPNLEFKRGLLYQRKSAGFRKKGHLIFHQPLFKPFLKKKKKKGFLPTFFENVQGPKTGRTFCSDRDITKWSITTYFLSKVK